METGTPRCVAESLTLDALLKTEPPETIASWLRGSATYLTNPRASRAGAVTAVVVLKDSDVTHEVTVGLFSNGRYFASCKTCGGYYRCAGANVLFADLAISGTLRNALLGYGSIDTAVSELPARRESARQELIARCAAFRWLELPPASSLDIEYLVEFLRDGTPRFHRSRCAVQGGLNLRVRTPREGKLLRVTDPWLRVLGSEDAAILAMCVESSMYKNTWTARGVASGAVLALLRNRAAVRHFVDDAPIGFPAQALCLRMVVEPAPTRWLDEALRGSAPETLGTSSAEGACSPALVMRWVSEDGSVDEPAWGALYFAGAQPQVWLPRCRAVHPVDPAVDPFVAAISSARPAMELPPGAEATICGAIRSVMRGRGVQLPSREDFGLQPEQPPELVLCVEGSPLDLQARVEAHYDFGRFELRPGAPDPGRDVDLLCLQQEVPNDFRRDSETESAALGSLASAGLCWDENRRTFVAVDHQAGLFWQRGAAALREGTPPFKLMVPEALRRTYWRPKVRSLVSVDLLENNVNATVQFDAGGVLVELRAVLEAIVARRRWVELRDGTVTELPDAIVDLADDVCDVLPVTGQAAVEPFHLGRLDRWVEVADEVRVDQGAANLCARLRAMALHDEPELPRRMRAKLRDYQRQGLAWLQLLDAIGAGGILADDMGLGKTLMTLVLLLWRKQRDGPCPSLVVCPRSVVGNWEAEAKKFTPSLRVARFDGAGGIALLSDLRKVDILVTSYGLLRRHAELLRDCPFRYAILDEAQYIKTANAQTTRAAGMLRAERRLALTGTPIENHLIELWSIVDFVNPGMLGTQKEFDLRFARPIHANPESPRAARLRAGVRPFVLRRTKAQVLTDLPPMQEIEMGCTPSEAQRELYDKLAKLARREVRKLLQEQGLSKSHVHVLAVLMRLRQCAIDPRLVDERSPAHASAKREVFLGLVRALRDEGRRALVFSQFVQVLSLWRKDLDREGIAYEYLDGSTRDRDQIVERFQQGSAPLFLISLRAGGSGLNLTAADTVILCDPWWNPAVEDQAAGRSHRIGQKRAVTVIRLVTRGTIEDKIEVLKARKRKIADAILAEGNASLGGLTEGDLERLLSDVNGQVADDETDEESCAS